MSCVQRLLLGDGKKLIYKSQLPPTVEPEFYERASSPLLPGHQMLEKLGDCATIVFDWIDAPLLRDQARSEAELVDYGRQVVAQIGEIRGELPVFLEVGSIDTWSAVRELTLYWAVEAQYDLFPDFRGPLFDQWSAEAITHLLE